jgi:superfamily II DNA or RNA helicase
MLTPYPHQKMGTEYLLDNNGGAIFSEPRTGKTLMVIRAIKESNSYPALIVAPSSVMVSWHGGLIEDGVSEEDILILDSDIHKMDTFSMRNLLFDKYDWVIVNYEKVEPLDILSFYQDISKVYDLPSYWKAIVLDESYRIASFDSNISQHIIDNHISNIPEDQMRIIMTGTPISETALDAVQQYMFINGEFFGYTNPFAYRNAKFNQYGYKWVSKSIIHDRKVKRFIKENSYQVRLRDLNLGGAIMNGLELLPLNDKQIMLNRWIAESNHYIHNDTKESMEMIEPVKAMFFHKVAAGIHPITNEVISIDKIKVIVDLIEDNKALILTRFTKPIPSMIEYLKSKKIKCDSISGADNLESRHSKRLKFQDGDTQVIVAQVNSVARGLDFSSADYIMYHNNSYSYEIRGQSELRAQNIKRSVPYSVIDICHSGSIDVSIRDTLTKKSENVNQYIKELTAEQIERWS